MSDLISRSELLNAFNNKNIQITFDLPVEEVLGEDVDLDDFAILVQDAIQSYRKMVIDTIKSHPTAYDIDKVVEEIKTLKEEALGEYNMGEYNLDNNIGNSISENYRKDMNEGRCFAYDYAIEIVKQGGVSDDVCEPSAGKVKVTSLEVIVTGSKRKPYYEIKYKEVGTDHYNIGYSSYNLDFVLDWKEKCFELIKVVE